MDEQLGAQTRSPEECDARLEDFFNEYLHVNDPLKVHNALENLVGGGILNASYLRNNNRAISVIKYLSRLYGLPLSFQEMLYATMRDRNRDTWNLDFKFKVVLALKYAVYHNLKFIKLINVVVLLIDGYPLHGSNVFDVVEKETIGELLLIIIKLLSPDRVQFENVPTSYLWKLENYVSHIKVNYKSKVKIGLERSGYWSGSVTQRRWESFRRTTEGRSGFYQNGEEIIGKMQAKRGINVFTHVVKTQQAEAITEDANVSEKIQMTNISICNILERERIRWMEGQRQKEALPSPMYISGSGRRWYRTTSFEILHLQKKAKDLKVIPPEDIRYLRDKLVGWKFGIFEGSESMNLKIAEIFYHVSMYQQIEEQVLLDALNCVLNPNFSTGKAQVNILNATKKHCSRIGNVSLAIRTILTDFYNGLQNDGLNKSNDAEKVVLEIFEMDKVVSEESMDVFISMLTQENNTCVGLNYVQKIISSKSCLAELKTVKDLGKRILSVATCSLQKTRNYKALLDGANCNDTVNEEHKLAIEDAIKKETKILRKALDVLEDYLGVSGAPELRPDQIDELIKISLSHNTSDHIHMTCVRLVLKSLNDGRKLLLHFEQFSEKQMHAVFGFLFQMLECKNVKRLMKALVFIILSNALENPELKRFCPITNRLQMDVFIEQLLRKDLILLQSLKIVEEEELTEEMVQKIYMAPEKYEYLSAFVANIVQTLSDQIVESLLNDEIISSALKAIHSSPDKNTKILCAKFFFELVCRKPDKMFSFTLPRLNQIQSMTFSPISDVRVYVRSAYCTLLAHQCLNSEIPVEADHVDFLVKLYQFRKLSLDRENFTSFSNPKILQVFKQAFQRGMQISEQVFHILAHILNKTCSGVEELVDDQAIQDILEMVYGFCSHYHARSLPLIMVEAVEQVYLQMDAFKSTSAQILEKCMCSGVWMSDEVIDEFSTNICRRPGTAVTYLKRLGLINDNQDLPDNIFNIFHMELISLRLNPTTQFDDTLKCLGFNTEQVFPKHELLRCLLNYASKGMYFSEFSLDVVSTLLLTWKGISEYLDPVFKCLAYTISNGQNLPSEIIERSLDLTNGSTYSTQLEFSQKVFQRNQQLPNFFLSQIFDELAVLSKGGTVPHKKKLLELIATMITFNQSLPPDVISNYLRFLSHKKDDLAPDLLSSIIRLLENGSVTEKLDLKACRHIMMYAVESCNPAFVQRGIKGVRSMPKEEICKEDLKLLTLKGVNLTSHPETETKQLIIEMTTKENPTQKKEWAPKLFSKQQPSSEVHMTLNRWKQKPTDRTTTESLIKVMRNAQYCEKFSSDIIKTLFEIEEKFWMGKLPNLTLTLAHFLTSARSAQGRKSFSFDFTTINILENEIQSGKPEIEMVILQAYLIVLEELKTTQSMKQCALSLADYFHENSVRLTWKEKVLICHIFKHVAETMEEVPTPVLDFAWRGVVNKDDAILRGECFSVLCILHEKNKIEDKIWLEFLETNLREVLGNEGVNESKIQLLNVFLTLTHVDKSVLKGAYTTNEDLIMNLMVADTVTFFSESESTQDEMELFPEAKRFNKFKCQFPQERLCIMHSIKDFLKEGHSRGLSASRIFYFINSVIEKDSGKLEWSSGIIKRVVFDTMTSSLSKKVKYHPTILSPTTVIKQACQLPNPIPLTLLDKIIHKIEEGDLLVNFKDLIGFIKTEVTNFFTLQKCVLGFNGKMPISELLASIKAAQLMEQVPSKNARYRSCEKLLKQLILRDLEFTLLQDIISKMKACIDDNEVLAFQASEIFENVLDQLVIYKVKSDTFSSIAKKLLDKKKNIPMKEWISICSTIVMDQVHATGSQGIKPALTVVADFKSINTNVHIFDIILEEFKSTVADIQEKQTKGTFKSSLKNIRSKAICEWSKEDIASWALERKKMKKKPIMSVDSIKEALAVISRACVILRNYCLSSIQILSVFCAIFKDKEGEKGRLQQVATGSGKSTIIAASATILCLMGFKVDIYTSNPVLAERDARLWSAFYEMFGFTCDHNGDRGSGYVRGRKVCYSKDIVYGNTAQFQFDALRQEYSNLETRGSRIYSESYALVDEVDAMFVDDSSKLARLSSSLPGMDLLHIIYHLIWHRLHDIQQRLFAVNGGVYYLEGVYSQDDDGNLNYTYKNSEGNNLTVPNFPAWIIKHQNEAELLENACIYKVHNVENFAIEHMRNFAKALIGEHKFSENGENFEKLYLPKAVRKFAKSQINNWVDSAMTAVAFTENVHYIIDSEQIKPVDYHSTGTIQAFTNWSNGLHQMLQVKHGLKTSTETVTTNFVSNIAMFQKYGSNLAGFTGTLGSEFGKKILQDVYSIDTFVIPELYYKRYKQLPPQVVSSQATLIKRVVHSAIHESQKKRAVLVICETIREAELIAGKIERVQGNTSSGSKTSVSLYTRNDQNQEKRVEQVCEGDIIVATNLAGRGTDINAAKIEPFGGLHVILTFLPSSLRVELQAFGRTARQGNKGSGELIVLSKSDNQDYQHLVESRDKLDRDRLSSFKKKQLVTIQAKDNLFSQFCKLYSQIRKELKGHALDTMEFNVLTPHEHTRLHAIEQEWAILLKKVDEKKIGYKKAKKLYRKFERRINNTYRTVDKSISVTENCYYWTQFGNEYYRRGNSFKEHTIKAFDSFQKAIKMDNNVAAEAHCGLGYCLLRGNSHWYKQNSQIENYKTEAVLHLRKCQDILNTEMGMLAAAQTLLLQRHGRSDLELFEQLTEKINLIGEYSSYVQNTIDATMKSSRRVYVQETWKSPTECSRRWLLAENEPRVLSTSSVENTLYDLEFHDLTQSFDMGKKDQALETLNNVDIKSISIRVSNQDLGALMEQLKKVWPIKNKLELRGNGSIPIIKQIRRSDDLKDMPYMIKIHNATPNLAKDLLNAASKVGFTKLIWEFQEDFGRPEGVCRKESHNCNIPELQQFNVEVYMATNSDLTTLGDLLPPQSDVSLVLLNVSHGFITQNWAIAHNATEAVENYHSTNDDALLETFTANTLTFRKLTKTTATEIIHSLRDKAISFVLLIQNMKYAETNKALKNCGRRVEDMKEKSLKEMGYQFSSTYIPFEAIQDLRQRGLVLMPEFSEVPFIPWRTMGTMGVIALVQTAVGGILLCTGVGSSVGSCLLNGGLSDFYVGYRIAVTREFSWKDYAIQKAVTLTISALSMGMSSLKEGVKLGGTMVQDVAHDVDELVSTRAATGEPVKEGLKGVGSLLQTAFTLTSVQQCESVARVGINTMIATVLDFTFEHVRTYIQKEVEKVVTSKFHQTQFFNSLATGVHFDQSNIFHDKISGWIYEVTNQQSHGWLKLWESLGSTICQAFTKFEHLQSIFSVISLVAGVLMECKELAEVVGKVCEHIESKLKVECTCAIQNMLGVPSNVAQSIVSQMVSENYPDQDFFHADAYKSVNLDKLKLLFHDMHEKRHVFSSDGETMSRLISSVVNQLTDHIIGVANRQLAQPLMTLAMGPLVSKISREIQNKFVLHEGQESNEQKKLRALKDKNPEELNAEEKAMLQKHDLHETNGEIYTPRELPQVSPAMTKPQKEEIVGILGGSSGGIGVAFILSKLHGANVKFVTDPNYAMTDEEINSGRRIVVWRNAKNKKNGAAKFTLKVKGVDGTTSNSEFNSVYQMFSTITGKSSNDLREQAAKFVAYNKEFQEIHESVEWVENKNLETTANLLALQLHNDIKITVDLTKKPKEKDAAIATTTTSRLLPGNCNSSSSSSTSIISNASKAFNEVKDFVQSEKETMNCVISSVSDHLNRRSIQPDTSNSIVSNQGTEAAGTCQRERESRACEDMPMPTNAATETHPRSQKLSNQNAPPHHLNVLIILHVILIILVSILLYFNFQ